MYVHQLYISLFMSSCRLQNQFTEMSYRSRRHGQEDTESTTTNSATESDIKTSSIEFGKRLATSDKLLLCASNELPQ